MSCANCHRPADEHTVLPGRGHPENGCASFTFAFVPGALHRLQEISDSIARKNAGETWLHCPCLSTAILRPCPNCGYLFCPRCHERHVTPQCWGEKDSRHLGMPYSQSMPTEAEEQLMDPVTQASVRTARMRCN